MDWTKNSRKIESLDLEICFQLQDNFYTGDPNNVDQQDDERYREPLELPPFARAVETLARTSEAIQHRNDLAVYYKTIVERSAALNKGFNEIRQYFWLRLWFWNTDEDVHISFPWYDSLSEMQQFIAWVKGDRSADSFVDMDQGWQIEAVQSDDLLHIRQTDPDHDEEHSNIAVAFEPFAEAVVEVEARAIEIISSLTNSLGTDVWTKYVEDATFGTVEWQPEKTIGNEGAEDGFFRRLFRR